MESETKFNVTHAAELAGVARQTIHRLIKQGKLSAEKLADGKTVIDKSELLRVFPNLMTPGTSHKLHLETSQVTTILQSHIERLERQLDVTLQELERTREKHEQEKDRLLRIIENQTHLLPKPQEPEPTPEPQPEPKKSWWQRIII
jgi:hypothetical protein